MTEAVNEVIKSFSRLDKAHRCLGFFWKKVKISSKISHFLHHESKLNCCIFVTDLDALDSGKKLRPNVLPLAVGEFYLVLFLFIRPEWTELADCLYVRMHYRHRGKEGFYCI